MPLDEDFWDDTERFGGDNWNTVSLNVIPESNKALIRQLEALKHPYEKTRESIGYNRAIADVISFLNKKK